jgi:hypothetical protein
VRSSLGTEPGTGLPAGADKDLPAKVFPDCGGYSPSENILVVPGHHSKMWLNLKTNSMYFQTTNQFLVVEQIFAFLRVEKDRPVTVKFILLHVFTIEIIPGRTIDQNGEGTVSKGSASQFAHVFRKNPTHEFLDL